MSERLKILIDKLDISQRQFAIKIGIDPGYLSRLIQGKKKPPNRILILIESVFGVNRQWLETGNGDIFKNEGVSIAKKQILDAIDTLNDEQINAVSSFLKYLTEKEKDSKEKQIEEVKEVPRLTQEELEAADEIMSGKTKFSKISVIKK